MISIDPLDDRDIPNCELDGVAEAIVRLVAANADRVNAVTEGCVAFTVWQDGSIEMHVTETIAEGDYEFRDGRVAQGNEDALARVRAAQAVEAVG